MKHLLAALAVLAALLAPRALALDVHDPAVAGFIDTMVEQHGFGRADLEKLFSGVEIDQGILASMQSPAEALPWYKYRAIFVNPGRIAAGREFLAENARALAAAEDRYGVPPEIVAALVGMESYYGKREGSHSALAALSTLAFDYPPRQSFFRKELVDYLLLCRSNHLDPAALKGSYAGALGAGQFMPSSYLAYAVDADGGGSDLFTHWPDIIASVAHYLSVHGWRPDQPVASPGGVAPTLDPSDLFDRTLKASALRARGVVFEAPVAATAPVRLVKVETRNGDDEYWVGLPNFLALMTYNRSVNYALAATELAAALATDAAPATSGGPLAAEHH